MERRRRRATARLEDFRYEIEFAIQGLRFEKNVLETLPKQPGWFSEKLASSPGPLVSDFVTHEAGFEYSTYGIHVGQDDRLTFMGEPGRNIVGWFVDCRESSPTLHHALSVRFAPSQHRRLVIPRGVAHTFDGLEHVVTRDEPIWYAHESNPDWNIDNDLVSVSRRTAPADFPSVTPNPHLLPDDAHVLLSRLSQSLLETPRPYLSRYRLKVGGKSTYVMFEPTDWADDAEEVARALAVRTAPGVSLAKGRYALTGPKSWTIVPNTEACVCDVLRLPASTSSEALHMHARATRLYTFLGPQGLQIDCLFVDCRRDSPTFGQRTSVSIAADPRTVLRVERGVAYSFVAKAELLVRCEQELYVDACEPRADIPMFGSDLMHVDPDAIGDGIAVPMLRCPDSVLRSFGKLDAEGSRNRVPVRQVN
jgi:dTDP-4-dehydrorhamnose 3,5-epimerase-like enzyme